jgi:hypothetical protein
MSCTNKAVGAGKRLLQSGLQAVKEARAERADGGPSAPPPGVCAGANARWERVRAVSDEFDAGRLDESKWLPHNPQWRGRAPGWFCRDNVTVSDGALQLRCTATPPPPEEPPEYTMRTAFVRSREMVLYGYYEARVTPADSVTSSAFWCVRPPALCASAASPLLVLWLSLLTGVPLLTSTRFVHNTPELWNEIDVFEICGGGADHRHKFHTNTHVFREGGRQLGKPRSDQKTVQLQVKACSTMVVGFDWSESSLTWLVNGRAVRVSTNDSWHEPMHLQFDSETMPDWFGDVALDDPRLPACFNIDYVRGWQRVPL